MSDDDAEDTKRSTSSDSGKTQQRSRKKTSDGEGTQKRSSTSSSKSSSAKSSTGSRSSQGSTRSSSTTSSGTGNSKSRSKSSEDSSSSKDASSSKDERPSSSKEEDSSRSRRSSSLNAVSASRKALEQFSSLTGRSPESVVGVQKSDDGWNVKLEVVEARRVPDTADLLAEYDISLDADGELVSYDRTARYVRGRPSA